MGTRISLWLAMLLFALPFGAAALDCPPPPQQSATSDETTVELDIAAVKKFLGSAGLRVNTGEKVANLYEAYPNADHLVLAQMIISVNCQILDEAEDLSSREKTELFAETSEQVLQLARSADIAEAQEAIQKQSELQHRETQESIEDLHASMISELRALGEGARADVQGVELPAGFDPTQLDGRYPFGWVFFFGYGSRLAAAERSFRTIEVVEWPNMRIDAQGAWFSGGDIQHKLVGGHVRDSGVFVPGKGRWSPYQIFDTCVWFELLREGDAGALGIVGFAPSAQSTPGVTLSSPACRD